MPGNGREGWSVANKTLERYMESILRRASREHPDRRFTRDEILRKFRDHGSRTEVLHALDALCWDGIADRVLNTYRVEGPARVDTGGAR